MSKKEIAKFFSDEDLKKISQEICEIEKITSGEIRLVVQEERGTTELGGTSHGPGLGRLGV